MRLRSLQSLAVLMTVVVASACTDPVTPSPLERSPATTSRSWQSERAAAFRSVDDEFADLVTEIPGFAAITKDSAGEFTVQLVNLEAVPAARTRIVEFLRDQHYITPAASAPRLVFRKATNDAKELLSWKRDVGALWKSFGLTALGVDKLANRVVVGVRTPPDSIAVERGLRERNFSVGMVSVQLIQPAELLASLRHARAPRIGGLGWAFNRSVPSGQLQDCTIGYNGWQSSPSQRVFVTNSHCVPPRSAVTGGYATQGGVLIGNEIADPPYFTAPIGGCPPGLYCRYSDAALIQYDPSVSSTLGRLAFTGLPACTLAPCGINITGEMTVTDDHFPTPLVGDYLSKTGQRTGWTRGMVTQTCFDMLSDFDPTIGAAPLMLCQTWVDAHADNGDSGSPVYFRYTMVSGAPGTASIQGVLWGRDPSLKHPFYFSPTTNVSADLGPILTY